MRFKDTIKLSFGNNLIMGNLPDKLSLEKVAEKTSKDAPALESYGFFDSNQANYNTYYPDVTAEDLAPKDNEFIYPVFRALSEVVVNKSWNPVDFGRDEALKKSMILLKGQTVNADHETSIGNAFGAVKDVAWQEAYTTPAGIKIPAGINSTLKLDGKSQPRIARLIMMDPPGIHSTSVTVEFLWEKSHPSMSQEEFFKGLGGFDKDGKLICRVASKINRYHEISLVGHGADPYAQRIKDGVINNPKYADISSNSAEAAIQRQGQRFFFFDMKSDIISNEEYAPDKPTIPEETNNNNSSQTSNNMDKKFLLALAVVMGLKNTVGKKSVDYTEETISEDIINQNLAEVINERDSFQARPDITEEEVTRLRGIETEYEAIKDVAPLKAFREKAITELRATVNRNLALIHNGAVPPAVAGVVKDASFETLTALNTQYELQIQKDFPMSCKDCNSTNVSRGTAALSDGSEGGETKPTGKKDGKNYDYTQLTDKQSKLNTRNAVGSIHGELENKETAK